MVRTMLWCSVDTDVKLLVEKLAKAKGVTISEYVRNLVLEDLDRRSIFTTLVKETLKNESARDTVHEEVQSGKL